MAILAGFAELHEDTVFNSAAYVDGRSPPVVYRKSHLYGDYERSLFQPAFRAPSPSTMAASAAAC
jgi:predicted amidohydrolase